MPSRNVAAGAVVRGWSARDERTTVVQDDPEPGTSQHRFRCVLRHRCSPRTHHAVALDRRGHRLIDRPLPNSEPDLVELFVDLQVHGKVLVVVDQLASIGALAIAVARSRGITVANLPGLAMRRIADLHPRRNQDRRPRRTRHRPPGLGTPTGHALPATRRPRSVGPDRHT